MNTHINIIAFIHLILGGLGLVAGAAVTMLIILAGGLGGAAALADASAGVGEALAVFGSLGVIGVVIGAAVTLFSLPQMITGWGLLKRRAWAPAVALILACFRIFSFPIGTVIAVYTGWAMLSEGGQRAYKLGGSSHPRFP